MHHQVFKISRKRLISLSTKAAFASGTLLVSQQQQQQQQQQGLESRLPRWISSSSGGGSNFGAGCWRPSRRPALAMSAGAAPGRNSRSSGIARRVPSGRLRFRGGATTDEPVTSALEAWPWKNPQGILVSPMDKRHYRWLRLPNGLQVMVISDPNATKAAAAMSVDVGAASDPTDLPGLAHFLEHMLFLGTSKYPVENAYKSYLAKHGGRSNASTSMDATTFQFEVGADHLRGALDIFSQFFVSPLFTESSTGRELLAVDSEDSKNRTNDSRRMLQVLKAVADPQHPYSKFSTGNLKTLKEDVPQGLDTRDQLLDFHWKHYHAANMALVVLGKEDLDHLEGWARECFKEVRECVPAPSDADSKTWASSAASTAPSTSEEGGQSVAEALAKTMRSPWPTPPAITVDVEPLRGLRRLIIQWPMPPVRQLWRSSPARVLSHLLGHEGPGSLYAALQDQGLANALSSGTRTELEDFSLFQVVVHLTKEGQDRWKDVAALVHAHTRLVRELPADDARRAWQESRDMGAIYFRFQQEVPPYSAATSISRRLQLYPSEEALSAGGVLDLEMDPALFSAFADYLRPDNTLTWRVWKGEEKEKEEDKDNKNKRGEGSADGLSNEKAAAAATVRGEGTHPLLEERWYGVPYGAFPTPDELLQAWSAPNEAAEKCLKLPGPNIFIPDDFSLVCDREVEGISGALEGDATEEGVVKAPDLLDMASEGEDTVGRTGQLWHRLDSSFRQPRAHVRVVLATPVVADAGGKGRQHARIMSDILHKVLAQRTYDAQLAGLRWGVSRHTCGYVLQVSGFSQKINLLLEQVVEAFLDPVAAAGGPEAFAKHFDLAKERALMRTKSWVMSRPDEVAHYYNGVALELSDDLAPDPGGIKAAEATNLEECLAQHKEALQRVMPVGLVYGNASKDDARRIWKTMTDRLEAAGCRPLPEEAYPRSLIGVLPVGKRVNLRLDVPNKHEENSAAVAYFQLGERDERKATALLLLSQMMREPCFTELRTRQQVGYIVSSGVHNYGRGSRQLGFSVHALSKTLGPDEICSRIDAFLPQFREILRNMSKEEFDTHVVSQIAKQLEPPKKADAEFGYILNEVFTGDLKWDRAAAKAELLRTITLEEVLALLDSEMLAKDGAKRMNILVYGKNHKKPSGSSEDVKASAGAGDSVVELVPETLQAFTRSLEMQDTTVTPQQAVAAAEMEAKE
eukprot:g12199.t1